MIKDNKLLLERNKYYLTFSNVTIKEKDRETTTLVSFHNMLNFSQYYKNYKMIGFNIDDTLPIL